MDHDFKGKVAVVLGGGQMPGGEELGAMGNGRAICVDLARHGATVVPVGRNLDRVQATVDIIEKEGGKGWAYSADAIHRDQMAKLFKDVKEKYGRVDYMVYVIGTNLEFDHATNTATNDAVARLFHIDFTGCVWATLESAPYMIENETGGAIVNVSSIASKQNGTGISLGYGMYSCAKAAMNKWSELSAVYYAPLGVRINTLVLGPVRSVMGILDLTKLAGGISVERAEAQGNAAVLLKGGRKSTQETANAVTFLLSDESKFVTGLEFVLDGGTALRRGPDPEMVQIRTKQILEELEAAKH
ncbi:MAG: SDR family oxidoreductase [Oscillospiraceae bacterium]|nr:SDR family oxidoreductase [Oscillospiraceae bacterium]